MRTLFAVILALYACSFSANAADRVIIRGDLGYEPIRLTALSTSSKIELKGARFRVAISKNENPQAGKSCESGDLPINRYPLAIEDSPGVWVEHGLFEGETPESSDWLHTYCNSTAIRLETSPGSDVRQMRMRRAWDGIRIDPGSPDFKISRVWMSDIRDDCIENDHLLNGEIKDSLFDGCFAGLSVATIDEDNDSRPTVRMDGILMRMKSYIYRGKPGHAMPIKIKESGPRISIENSIFAVETDNLIGGKHAPVMWNTITKCSNNKLLWLGDGDLPEVYQGIPDCFEVVTGAKAHDIWNAARTRWIEDHPDVPRFSND